MTGQAASPTSALWALPALIILAWLAAMRQWRLLGRLVWLPGLGLFVAPAAPWFVAMQLR